MHKSWDINQFTRYNTSIKSFESSIFSSQSCFSRQRLGLTEDRFLIDSTRKTYNIVILIQFFTIEDIHIFKRDNINQDVGVDMIGAKL